MNSFEIFSRSELELSTNIVHCKSIPGVPTRHEGIDLVIIRENTEGEYANLEHEVRVFITAQYKIKYVIFVRLQLIGVKDLYYVTTAIHVSYLVST